ncbi:response regulator [Pseudomonas sp. RC3H12]|uniref:response regulator n=1 Tax=Pseudomonas sp. RC3H12 TaxID=2834406 RepID=UPI00203306EE|nr:response regulator [Pseudomonas sp. RC3H12]
MSTAHTAKPYTLLARSSLPDLIILDITMPEMDGFQVLGELRKSAERYFRSPLSTEHRPVPARVPAHPTLPAHDGP